MQRSAAIETESLQRARDQVAQARHLVCLTGAGLSAESGIPTFRDAQKGLWSRFDPAELASEPAFRKAPGRVWSWYRERYESVRAASPNPGHKALALIQSRARDCRIVSQNVDDLLERGGASNVYRLHGDITRCKCSECARPWAHPASPWKHEAPPTCDCGGLMRPDVVWFGEFLDPAIWNRCLEAAANCDVALVVGTSGMVAPASDLPELAASQGAAIIEVNPERTGLSQWADLWLQGSAARVLPALVPSARPAGD